MKRLKLPLATLVTLFFAAVMFAAVFVAPLQAQHGIRGVDFAGHHGRLNPEVFKKEGVEFVVRYVAGYRSAWKEITPAEADMWSKAGVKVVLVWQTSADRATKGYEAGYTDASLAFPQATRMGMPDGKPIYFAVDVDVSGPAVEPYFRGVFDWTKKNFPDSQATSRIGVYGGARPVKHIMDGGYAKYGWQARAWMHGHGWLPDVMHQHAYHYYIDGVETDGNRVFHEDYGQWYSTRVMPPVAPQLEEVRQEEDGSIALVWKDKSDNEAGFRITDGQATVSVPAGTTTYRWGAEDTVQDKRFQVTAFNRAGTASSDWVVAEPLPRIAPDEPAAEPTPDVQPADEVTIDKDQIALLRAGEGRDFGPPLLLDEALAELDPADEGAKKSGKLFPGQRDEHRSSKALKDRGL